MLYTCTCTCGCVQYECICKYLLQTFTLSKINDKQTCINLFLCFSTCESARWNCTDTPVPPKYNVPDICDASERYTSCKSDCPLTCATMNQPPSCPAPRAEDCEEGCECKDGYVLEKNKCIRNNTCPCYHGGKPYFEGDKYIQDCNEW